MSTLTILLLRALILLIVAGAVLVQIFAVPVIADQLDVASGVPVAIPYAIAGILIILALEVALLAVWMLLGLVRRDSIFSDRAFRWVDVIIGTGAVATVLVFALGVHCYFVLNPILDAPGLVAMAVAGTIGGAAGVLLVFVMRGLLRKATDLRSELDEVV